MSKKLICLLFGMFMFVCASTASAVNVEVNVGAYDGAWHYDGTWYYDGTETIDISVGSNWIQVGRSGAGRIHFDVDSGGNVTSGNEIAATGGAGTLTFNTTDVTIDPVNYKGFWALGNVTRNPGFSFFSHHVVGIQQDLAVVPTLSYLLQIGSAPFFRVDVDADGTVTSHNTDAATGGSGTLTFENVTIKVDPGDFNGTWSLNRVAFQFFDGRYSVGATSLGIQPHDTKSIVVAPGLTYFIRIALGDVRSFKFFSVDTLGKITNNAPESLEVLADDTIRFITVPVTINPQGYLGQWGMGHAANPSWSGGGVATYNLVPYSPYNINFSNRKNPPAGPGGLIEFFWDANGDLTSSWPTSIVASGKTLTFNNTTINIDAADYTHKWTLGTSSAWAWASGSQSVVLLPDWSYVIYMPSSLNPNQAIFAVDTDGNVTSERPESYTADGTDNTLSFNTALIHVDSGNYTGSISFIDIFTAPDDKVVVLGLDYRMFISGGYWGHFTIGSPCAVTNFPDVFTRTADDTTLDVSGFSLTCVAVEPPPPVNEPPFADAGGNVLITSADQYTTTINGIVTDPDVGDVLTYRWLEGTTELQGVSSVNDDGSAPLSLASVFLLNGEHTLTLEATDGLATVTGDMILTIGNSPPTVVASGGGTYQAGADITLSGQVADFDGDTLSYSWSEGINILASGSIITTAGGTVADLPDSVVESGLSLGEHTITLTVNDGSNDPVSADITVTVIDTTDPSISATVSPGILWPPNHKMVDVVIQVNASDNGGDVTLTATVDSNVSANGDGNTLVDFSDPVIDQGTGLIVLQLRAERSGKGAGRTYTITVTATDDSGNSSDAVVTVVAPHDKGKK